MRKSSIALIQMEVTDDKERNLSHAETLVEAAATDGADLVVLPEMFTCPYDLEKFHPYAEPIGTGPAGQFAQKIAKRFGLYLVAGSIPEKKEGKVFNTATLWSPEGELLLAHRKVHLFDIDIPDGITFRESERLAPGDTIQTTETRLGRIGLAICYDLRFPELFRRMVLEGADLIILPGAFNTTTGPAHWEPLIRARAIENTVYFAACAPAPHKSGSYPSWGHSMVVDPYGTVLAEADRTETILQTKIDPERLSEVRRGLPVLQQRRPDVYG